MFDKVLVPLDGSELAERALAPAFALAQRQQGQVLLLRVAVLFPDTYLSGAYGRFWPEPAVAPDREAAAAYLKAIQSRAPAELRVRTQVLEGGVPETILTVAATEGANLIVMSSHGYSGITRWILGSVAEKVLGGAPCPVLVVRSAEPVQRMLIPLDGSALAEQALDPGLAVAAALECKVTLLRAVPRLTGNAQGPRDKFEPDIRQRLQNELVRETEEALGRLIAAHASLGVAIHSAVVFEPAAPTILKHAETHAKDLIVISTHGCGGQRRWVYGAVAEKILRGAHCMLLVVRPPAHQLSG